MWADEMGSLLANWAEQCGPPSVDTTSFFLWEIRKQKKWIGSFSLSEPGFDPGTCGLWAHHASAAPL